MKAYSGFAPKRVLFATDFSKLGNQALRLSGVLLGEGAVARVLYVLEPVLDYVLEGSVTPGAALPVMQEEETEKAMVEARRELEHLIRGMEGENIEGAVVMAADPALALVKEAGRFNADLVCMSTHGRSGLSRLMAGSVAQRFQNHYSGHVLLYRPKEAVPVKHAPGSPGAHSKEVKP